MGSGNTTEGFVNQLEDPARGGSSPKALGAEKDGRARSARLASDPTIWRAMWCAMEFRHAGAGGVVRLRGGVGLSVAVVVCGQRRGGWSSCYRGGATVVGGGGGGRPRGGWTRWLRWAQSVGTAAGYQFLKLSSSFMFYLVGRYRIGRTIALISNGYTDGAYFLRIRRWTRSVSLKIYKRF